ncbi:MAG: protein phosphatase 2C domain-containing protein [Deltaproteobacteria bacterium]|nr:protein phosphatase 2C domain-containing protein [Deltaproteobacteria bacterium]
MGDGAIDLGSPKTNELYGPPPPPPPVSDKDKTEDKKEAAPPPPPPSPQELQKITAEVKKFKSLKLPEDMFDSEGNLKPERLKDAKDLLAEKARDLKKTDLGASARMMQQAVSLYPSDTNLRLEAAQYWVEWADKTKDKNVRMAQLERAFQFLKDVDVDPAVDPVVAGEKFRIAKRLCAGHIGTTKDFEKATYYLDQAVRNGQPHELIELLNGFKEHPHPEVYGKYDNPYDFFADALVDAVRFEDAKGVYDMAARDTETSDPAASKFFKEKSQIVAQHLDPKPDYDKFSAWQDSYQGVMDGMLEANGRYNSAFAGDAKSRVQKQAQAFVETPDMQKLRPGSEEFNRRLTHFLSQETEYHLLPTKEQADVLKEGVSVNYDGKKFTYDLVEVYKDKWYPYRGDFFSTDAGRKGLWLKREGDRLMAQGGGGPIAAVAHYQKSLDLNPDDTMARVGLARAQTAMGKMAGNKRLQKYCFDLAAKNLGYTAEGDPNKWQVLHATGDLLLASGHPKQALSFLQEALRLARQTGAPEYSLNDKIAMSGPGGAEVKLNYTPLGESIQKAMQGSAEAMGKELYSEDVKPRDRLVEAMMRKGVTASQVTEWWNKSFTVLKTSEDKVGGDQFLEYALKHLDQFRGELEQVYGKLPYDKEGKLNPNLQQAAQTYLDGRKKRAEDAAAKQGLKPDTPEFKEAVEATLKQKDDLAEAYTTLLAPNDASNPGRSYIDKAGAYNVIQGVMLEAAAEEAKAQGPGGVQKAFQYYQQAGEAFKRSYDLTGDRRFMRTSAKSFYQAAYIARQGGDEQAARDLFLKGATVLQFGGEATLRDPQALKLMGDGLMEVGRYKDAKAIYDSAQEPLIQYFGSHDDAPEGLLDRLKLSSIYCHKMAEVEEKLGLDFMDAKAALTEKRNAGTLTPAEKADLERMEKGYDALKRLCGLQFPPVIEANDMPGIRNLREDIISAIHAGDVKKFDELMTTAQRQIQNAETLQMADSLRKKTLLPQLPPQVQEYIKRTNDWSVLRASYQEGDHLPEDWNPAQLNDMPVLKALREWDEKNPEQAKQIRASLEAFGRGRLVPGGEAATDLEKFNAEVDAVAKTLFKTDADGKLPVDPKTGARIFEPTEAFGAWFQDATELDLRDKPEAWMQSNLTEYRQNLGAIGKTLASFEAVRKDYKETQAKLVAAEQAGNAGQAAIHKKHLEDLRGQIGELRANYTQVFQAQVGEFNADLTQFETHSKKLGKVGQGGKYAYQDALLAAQGKLKTTGDGLSGLAADADPEQVLDAMIGSAQELARAESTLLKGVTLVHTSNLQGFKPGEMRTEVEDFAGEDMKYHGSSKPATVKTWWEADPKWTAAMENLDKQFEEGGSFDATGIDKLLTANLAYLKETDQQMFKDLPTTVREGISMQLSQLHTMRKQKLDAGEEVREYDTLIEKYQDAEKALKAGNVERALALFRVATESKRQSRVHKDFENFQSDQKWKMIALEVAIITAAAAATAVTMGALAPVAGAAAAAGTAAIATEVGLILLEGAVFVGYEMLMRSALYAAKEEFQLKGFGMSTVEDPWRDIHGVGDLGWKVVTNAAMLKALKVVGEGYQVFTLSERALARAGATALLEDATAVGMRRAMMRELLQKEMAELSMGGKALYNVGAFTAEAAGMQAWSSAQIGLDMLYQRVAHGKKLEWKQYTAALEQANSAEQIEHGIATLVGLKLGGLTTHPIIARYQSSTQVAASQKIKLDLFVKTKGQFETRLQTEMEKAALAGKPFEMTPELRGEARKLMEIGHEAMDVAGQLEKGKGLKVFTEQEKTTWKESHDWLGKWVEYSGKESKLKGGPAAPPADDKKGAAPAKGEPDAREMALQQREKAREEQRAQWTEAFGKGVTIEKVEQKGQILGYRVKGAEGPAADLFLKDKTKGELWATPEQFQAYRAHVTQERTRVAEAKRKADAEALAPEFEQGVTIRPKVDKYEPCDQKDPNATPVEGAGKKVTYYVKVKPDGTRERLNQRDIGDIKAGRSPEVLGFEKVDKEGKVIDGPPISRDDHEAYQHWYGQKKEAAKVVVLKAVEPPADSGQPSAPAPKKKAADADPAMTRAADAGRAFDLSFDHAMRSGKPPTTEELTQVVQRNMESLEALQPALDGLPKTKRQAVKEGLLQQLADGKLTKDQAVELAAKIAKGEAEIVPNAKAEYGYEVKVKEAPKPKADDLTKTDPTAKKGAGDAGDAGPPTQRDGAKGKKQASAPEDPILDEGVRRVLESQSGKVEWQRTLKQAEGFGTPKDKAAAKEVRTAADNVKSLSGEYLKAKAELKKHTEGSPERLAAQKRADELQGELRKNLDVIQKWEDYPKERTKVTGHLRDAAFPFLERAIQGQGHDKGLGEAPEGTRILDVSFRQPGYGDDFQAGPGKTTGEYEVLIHVRTEADAQAVLKEARLNHGENKAQFVKDADGKVRSVEMTTPDGRVFSVRVELATTENRAEVTDRGGIAGASHEGVGYKEYNEDRQVVVTFENGRTVTLVIDGMGGTQGGEMAAKLAKTAFEKAVKEGKSVEDGIRLANEAVAAYGKELLPALTERLMKEQNLDRATAEHYAKYMLPGAVAMGTEISRNPNGTFNARFRSVGDCEAAVIRFKPNGEVEILDAYGRSEADILKSRSDPNANIVDQSLGGHSGPLKIRTKDVTVEQGDIVLNGSDGFFENFGSHAEIAFLIRESGAKTPAEVRDVLMREVLIRQQLADTLQKSGQENMPLTPEAYAKAYRAVTGQEPPSGWKGMWEGKVLDMMGNVGEAKDLGRVQVTYADGQSFEFRGVPRDKTQSHFKQDNTTLVVQGVGDPVRPDTVTPSRAELAKEQMGLALELARSFGLEKNADFMKDLNALVLKDVASGGRTQDAAGREALLRQRVKEAKVLAERYGMDKNPAFMKLLGRLVVDNLREAEVRFGEAPKQGAPADPKLTGFMERQRGYGLKLAKGFEAKVDPAKREKFKMDLGKILSQDAAGLPSGGDPAIEAKFKTNREAVVEAFAKEYGLDGDANFVKAAKMLLVDRVLKDCPRVEPKGPKVDPIVQQTGQRLESEIFDRALRAGRNKEEAAQLAEQARGHFDAAVKEGKSPYEAFDVANGKMAAEFQETVRPGAAAPKELPPAERETVRPGKAQAGDKQALTPSGVRPKGSPGEETTGDLKAEVDHLAAGDTPFAEAARDLQAGKITQTEYRARQKAVAEKMVEDHKGAFEDVMGFLKELGADPDLHLSQEFPPKGRMKAADDLAPKLVRRGWQDMAPLTDIAGTRIVVRSNADAEAVIARIQEKYKIREAYLKDGSMEADVMTPTEMKRKGIQEEEGVVWIDAKLDQDGIHRLVDGHPASGYRALHIVVEVDGKPVEIQIKTEAMHEWGEIEHKLVYKNKDLPPEILDPIKDFRREASDYLAKVTHLGPGEKAPEMPKPPQLPADVPNRAEIQRGLDDMVSLMQKYSEGEPSGGQVFKIPKAPKAPDVDGINRKVAYLNGLYERIFPEPVGRPGLKNMDLVGELDMIRERLVEGGHQALLEKFDADYKTLMTEPTDSPQFKVAMERLGDVLALNHGDPRFRQPVVFMTEAGFAEFAKASQEVYDKSAASAPGAKEGKGADVIPLRPRAKTDTGTETRKAADSSDPEKLGARLKDADPNKALEPLAGIEKRLEAAEPELAAQMKADRETILKGKKDSPEYQDALERLELLDAALRGPLEYGKELSDKSVADLVRPLYVEKGSDSQGPKGSGRDSNTGTLATGTGLLMGLLALVAPETARAADGVMRGGPNIGPVEIAMIVGIGTLLAIPVVRRFLSAPKPSADLSPATRDNPVRLEHNGVVTAIRPLETRDYQGGRVVDGFVGTFSKEGAKVHGDGVELVYRVTDPSSGAVTANTKVYLSKAEAQRLGIKFDAKGTQVAEVPNHGFVVKQYAVGTPANVGVAADAGPRGGSVVANHPALEVSAGTTYFQVMADPQGRPVVNQYMGQVSPPLLTFQRGPKGQWYVFEGKPSMDLYAAQADPVARRYWKPVKDNDLFQVGNNVVPFKAPAEAWIQYQMPDGSVQGYAPPAASGGALPIAVSGKLPVGEARTVVPKSDGSPFVIGRGQGDLQFTDSNVSGVHATIVRNHADGKWYLVDGPMGDASKVSTNGVYVMGGRMPKYYPIKDGEYFVINGATFQFREPAQAAPQAPPAPPPPPAAPSNAAVLQVGPHGGPAIDLGGRSFTVSPWQQGWTEMGTQYLGRIASASRVPNDPQGKVRLDVRTRRGMGAEEGRITLEMTPAEAAALNIKLRPDGSLQPGPKEPYLSFGEILPQPLALAADANPVVPTRARPQPPPPPARRGPVDLKDGAGQAYQLEAAPITEGLVPGKLIGSVTRLEPLPGNSGGKLFMVVEIRPDLRPDSPVKTVSFSVTPQEAARLGLKLDAQGRLVEASPRGLKISMPGADVAGPKPKPGAPGEIQGVWADNAPGAPRRGEVGKKEATEVYGTSAGKTHEGIGYKEKNEDAVVQGDNFAVVLDGMGGHKGGDAASRISGEAIAKYISENQGKMPPEELLTKALLEGDRAVKASDVYKQASEKEKPGAVGVVHLVVKNPDGSHDVYLAHVGDAGAVVVGKDGKVKHRTADQSLLHDFYKRVMSGELQGDAVEAYMNFYPKLRPFYEVIQKHGKDPERMEMEIRAHPYANIVSGGLGTSGDPKPIVQKFRLEPGDKIVMFSDGVGDANATADLAKVAHESKSAKEASDRIMDGTLERMADLEDAMAELPPGKRLPIVRSDGEIAYVDNKGNIYKSLKPEAGEKPIDHYKADNATVHVYFHDPKAGGSDPVKPGPGGGVKESGVRLKPPPLPPGAKQAPKVEAIKPENDIDFKSLPPENLLTQDELAGLDRLNKRPHVKEILHDPTLRPVTKVTVGDQTFYLSRVIETVDERGEVRPHVLALVPVKENGQTVLKRRFFYKSNSDGGWRASPYILGGKYAKGVGKHYTQETQPIPELNAHFQKLEEAAGGVTKVRMTDAEFDKYIDVGSPLLNQDAQGTMLAGFGKEVMFPSNVGMTNIGALQPGAAFKAGAYSGASDPAIVPKLASLTYPEGFIPDFAQAPAKTYTETHTLLGKITCREFQGGYLVEKGSGRRRPVVWTMAEDANGRTWVKSIRYTDSKVNSYGVYDEVIDSGIITSKPLEYAEQSYKLPAEYRPDFNGQYVDITPALHMLKPIRDYRASRGLSNPEIPKGPPAPIPPPSPKNPPAVPKIPPPPPQTPKVVQSQVQGLSGTEGKWVYRMEPNQPQVLLGRESFMGVSGTEGVSGKHVRIFRADGTTFIEDSVSMNGTQVWRDGKMVWASRGKADAMKSIFPIRPGDKIFMGGVEVTFNPA